MAHNMYGCQYKMVSWPGRRARQPGAQADVSTSVVQVQMPCRFTRIMFTE